MLFAEKVANLYPQKIVDISDYLSKDEGIRIFFNKPTKEEIAQKLHEPIIKLWRPKNEILGTLTYCNHELDYVHIIDLEFEGALETFGEVSING